MSASGSLVVCSAPMPGCLHACTLCPHFSRTVSTARPLPHALLSFMHFLSLSLSLSLPVSPCLSLSACMYVCMLLMCRLSIYLYRSQCRRPSRLPALCTSLAPPCPVHRWLCLCDCLCLSMPISVHLPPSPFLSDLPILPAHARHIPEMFRSRKICLRLCSPPGGSWAACNWPCLPV